MRTPSRSTVWHAAKPQQATVLALPPERELERGNQLLIDVKSMDASDSEPRLLESLPAYDDTSSTQKKVPIKSIPYMWARRVQREYVEEWVVTAGSVASCHHNSHSDDDDESYDDDDHESGSSGFSGDAGVIEA